MKQITIFEQGDITVVKQEHNDERGGIYWVSDKETTYTTTIKPFLDYRSLQDRIDDYKKQKEEAYAADDREVDFWANFDRDTEAV